MKVQPRGITFLLASSLLLASTSPTDAWAQDEEEDEEGGYDEFEGEGEEGPTRAPRKRKNEVVREIVRGTYAKSNIGTAFYLGQFAGFVNLGTSLGLSVGRDFVDQERLSMAGELMFFQGIHNGCHYDSQVLGECPSAPGQPGPLIQGDLRTYTLAGVWEVSLYPSRRIGIGLRAGGGLLLSPLLMDETYYQSEVVETSWGGQRPAYHDQPHPVVLGGPTFEYYTKLSHFSVGLDADVFYAIGFDLGASTTGYLKYTF